MADYENKVHNVYLTSSFTPTQNFRVTGTVTLNKSEGGLQEVIMPDIEDRLNGDLEDQDFNFENAPTYSDLDYELLKFSVGFQYKLTPMVTLTADGDFADLTDNEGYIYGIESGSYFMIRSGVKLDF